MQPSVKSVSLEKLCRSIFSSNHAVQSVEVVSKAGRILEKLGPVKNIKINNERRDMSSRCLFEISLGEELDDLYGSIQYDFSEGNFSTLIFPFNENFVVVTTAKNISPISLATKIAQIIIRFN